MSAEQPEQTGNPQPPQQPVPAAVTPADAQKREAVLVKLYCEITGETESQARNAVVFVVADKEESNTNPPN